MILSVSSGGSGMERCEGERAIESDRTYALCLRPAIVFGAAGLLPRAHVSRYSNLLFPSNHHLLATKISFSKTLTTLVYNESRTPLFCSDPFQRVSRGECNLSPGDRFSRS